MSVLFLILLLYLATLNLSNGKINAFIIYVNAVEDIYTTSLLLSNIIEILMKF